MQVEVRAYKNTKFDKNNIPSGPSVLNTHTDYIDIANIYVTQLAGLTYIDLPLTYNNTRTIDYIRLTGYLSDNTTEIIYYTVEGPANMVNETTARIPIQEDYITTHGITQADIISGNLDAAHVPVDDWEFLNVAESRFTPSGVLTTDIHEVTSGEVTGHLTPYTDTINLVNCTLDILDTATNEDAVVSFGSGSGDTKTIAVAMPITKACKLSTIYNFPTLSEVDQNGLPVYNNNTWYSRGYTTYYLSPLPVDNVGDDSLLSVQDHQTLNFIRSLGLEDSIINSYDVPLAYINQIVWDTYNATKNTNGNTYNLRENIIKTITPNTALIKDTLEDLFKFEYTITDENNQPYKVRNKKVFAGQNNQYILISKATGNKITYNPEDLIKFNNYTPLIDRPAFIVSADLRAGGSPYIYPLYLNNQINKLLLGVHGLGWAQHTFNYLGQYGADVVNNKYNFDAATNLRSYNQKVIEQKLNIAGSGAQVLGGIIGGIVGILSSFGGNPIGGVAAGVNAVNMLNGTKGVARGIYNIGVLTSDYDFQNKQLEYNRAMATQNTIAPNIEFPYEESSREWYDNYFTIIRTRYSAKMAKQMDNYYDLWGYQLAGLEMAGDNRDWFNNRQYFNYISASNVLLNKNISMWEKELIKNQLLNVRLWHVIPSTWTPANGNPIVTNNGGV